MSNVPARQLFAAPPKAAAEPAAGPTTAETTDTSDPKVKKLLDYLEGEYAKKLTGPYWVTRAMAIIALSRSPRPTATTKLFEVLEKDKQDVVRLLAWQAVLARIGDLDAKSTTRFYADTLTLADKDAFHGQLRVALLQVLACNAPNAKAKKLWEKIFSDTNAWQASDIPVLDELGRCLAAWHSGQIAETLVQLVADPNHGVRAEYVLHAAGSTAAVAKSTLAPGIFDPTAPNRVHPSSVDLYRRAQAENQAFFSKNRASWKDLTKIEGEPFKSLRPQYLPAPVALDAIDPDDASWTRDLELGKADLGQFEAVFVVDATGSMGDVLAWLKHDMGRVMQAFTLVCKEPPALGITFYRDRGEGVTGWVVKQCPLTYKLADLGPDLMAIQADGGGDIPEAVLDGLQNAIENNKWSGQKLRPATRPAASAAANVPTTAPSNSNVVRTGHPKEVILIGDAPPHPETIPACVALAKKAAAAGLHIHAVKVTTDEGKNDLTSFQEIADAGGGTAIDVEFHRQLPFRFLGADKKEIPMQTMARPEAQTAVSLSQAADAPGEKILALVLADAISPAYRDRVEPLAKTLLAYCDPKSEPEARKPFPANTPPVNKGTFNTQKK